MNQYNNKTSQHHDGDCSEEGTTFRSVPLQQTLQRPTTVLPPPSLVGGSLPPLKGASFAKLPPLSLKKSAPVAVVAPVSASTPVPTWSLQEDDVPQVPDYPLEQTAISLKNTSLQEITSSIMTMLHEQGIACSFLKEDVDDYDDFEILNGRVDCTRGDLKFVLQLWRSTDKQSYIVEIQRRCGSAHELHHLRRPLFQTLLGQPTTKLVTATAKKVDRPLRFPPPLRC